MGKILQPGKKEWEKSKIISVVLKQKRGTEKLIDFVDESAGEVS